MWQKSNIKYIEFNKDKVVKMNDPLEILLACTSQSFQGAAEVFCPNNLFSKSYILAKF